MTNRVGMLPALLWLAFLALPLAAWGLINPQFTPIHLVDQCDTILTARIKTKDIVNKVELEVSETLKGKAPAALVLDLSDAPKERADAARKQLLAAAGRSVLFFSADDTQTGYLHVQGTWLKLSGKGGAWRLEAVDQNMLSTWDGATDMLTRCVQYILADRAAAAVPAEAGLRWRTIKKIGSVVGQARDIAAINVAGDGTCCLFVASDKGDRLLRPGKDGAFEDITEKVKLASRSRLATWGNFGGSGRLDLASYDGATLTIWTQAADGTFSPVKPGEKFELPEGCVGMATIAVGAGMGVRTPGLIFSPLSGLPVLLKPAGKYAFEAVKPFDRPFDRLTVLSKAEGLTALSEAEGLPVPATAPKDYGKGQACLVADFNGDSLVDVIQPFEKGGLIYLGNKEGSFDAPKACAVCATVGGGKAALGDFDGDGLLDVLMPGAEGVKIFQNRGQGLFEEAISASGEIGYKNLPLASGCGVCDFNNDTRQDILVTYGAGPMLLYFNRGFRSFGQVPAREVALNQAPDIGQGQQLGLFADLGGGGTQDLFLVAQSGDIWCAFNDLGSESAALCVKARLRAGSPEVGPVNVSLWKEERCLGTAVVQAGLAPAFFGIETAGAYTLKWRFPGGREMSREAPVMNKPVTVELEGAK